VGARRLLALVGALAVGRSPTCVGQEDSSARATSPTPPAPSATVIDAARLTREGVVRDIGELLMDRVPGLLVVPGSGLSGTGSRIRLRGVQSLVDDRPPLVFVDGMRVDQTEDDFTTAPAPGPLRLADLSVEDIESVEVVGPAGAAVYGPGAAGGVLLIRTKRGRGGPPRWEAYAAGGVRSEAASWPANYGGVDLDNPYDLYRHGRCTLAVQAAGACVQDFVQQFNPLAQRNPFRTALHRQYGLSMSGGSSRADYRLAGDFSGSDGPFSSRVVTPDPNYYRRLNFRGTGAARPWPSLEVSASVARTTGNLGLPPDILTSAVFGPSDSANFSWTPSFRGSSTQGLGRTSGVVAAHWTPVPWLALHGLAGWDAVGLEDAAIYSATSTAPRSLTEGRTETRHRTLELAATVTRALSSHIRSTTTLGTQRLRDSLEQFLSVSRDSGNGFPACNACAQFGLAEWGQSVGYYGDEQLDFGGRLFVSGALRYDKFKAIDRSMTHPSLSVAWIAHRADSTLLNLLRIRAAYGSAGRELPAFLKFFIVPPLSLPLPRIEPERTKSIEVGADADLLGGRLGAQLTYYDMRSEVLKFGLASTYSGFVPTYSPGATISNRGIEATLVGKLLTSPRLSWDVSLSLWGNRNRLVRFDGPPVYFGTTMWQGLVPGYPVGGYWAFPVTYADSNGNGIIEPWEARREFTPQWAGTPYPTQGAVLTSAWRVVSTLRLSATLDYRAGQTLFNADAWWRCAQGICRQANDPRTPLAEQAQAVAAPSGATPMFFEGADYLKLRELAFTYFAPPGVAAALRARTATITLAGRDLATWTGYSGVDPEAGSYGVGAPGRPRSIEDFATMPLPHTWTLRVDLVY
jgi:outer membrane receptor protein involved in Fe transport